MIREPALIDFLATKISESFSGTVYRATRLGLDPTTPSTAGGRWMPRDGMAVLYTSLEREGALAEVSFHLGLLTPTPTRPIAIHTLRVAAQKVVQITRQDFPSLAINPIRFGDLDYHRPATVGDAIGFLEFDAMIVPSARWECENLVLIEDNRDVSLPLELIGSEEVAWFDWACSHGFIR
ncbi:MAG: RES family NAD+ phosphorylase [Terriglobales bacterium]